MSKGNPLFVGATPISPVSRSGDLSFDRIMDQVMDELNQLAPKTAVVYPWQAMSLKSVISALPDHGYLMLTDGVYELSAPVAIDKPCTIVANGKVVLRSSGTSLNISGDNVVVIGVWFDQTSSSPDRSVTVSGDNCGIKDCMFSGPQDFGVYVTGDDNAVCGCRFIGNASHGAGDADIYYSDAASNGIVSCTMRSATRQHTLNYKTGTSMSEAANGPSAVINVRP